MHRLRKSVVAALCTAALLMGCTDAPTPTEGVSDISQPAFASSGPVVATVTGSGHRYRPAFDLWRTFSINATKRTDGTVKGSFQLNNHGEALPAVRGPVVCLSVAGNQAWLGTVIEKTDDPGGVVGGELAFRVVDNGEGNNAAPDEISFGYAAPGGAQAFCDEAPANWPPVYPIDAGNIRVHSLIGRCVPPPDGMVGWWPGDGDGADIAGGNHATLENGAAFGAGFVAEAFSLDGEDDFVNVPHAAELDFGSGDFTVDLWVNFRSIDGEQVMVEKWIQAWGNPMGWTLTKIGTMVRLAVSDTDLGEYDIDVFPSSIPTDTWIHVAATRAGDTYTLFWNGEVIASSTLGVMHDLSSGSSVKFGHRGNPDDTPGSEDWRGFYMNGLVDEVELLNRALSPGEIMALYEAGSSGKCKQGMHP